MDLDILYLISTKEKWKSYSSKGFIRIESEKESTPLYGLHPDQLQDVLNFRYANSTDVLLILVDPIRLQVPIKMTHLEMYPLEDDSRNPLNSKRFQVVEIHGNISIDAVIDRIPLHKKESEDYSVTIDQVD